ncbi:MULTISPECIES: metallophosphoesterase family protein [unclassified Methylobacterium]|uniref:metallophosphoesterase family protein n=1 Tax=unclassified Methylobacterium TaxID=2615210 RepID=UPI001FBA6CA4|nr:MULTISPECIES: metallophosphoesterase family protein [unclassified Methylobacterium]MCJ2096696.1 metallophosphoesterase family protein [Methylobacterium sp. J-072]MCJ2118398.1 metallophosphoesterase family protein [Methylobacterium sp. J-001]
MPQTWFTSDTHFGHTNVIAYSDRPFLDIREHDEALIAAWNARVASSDEIWHLGDFALGLDATALARVFRRLHGRKHLIVGNHDARAVLRLPWSSPPRQMREIVVEDRRVVLCHYAMRSWRRIHRGAVHLYGHTHATITGTRHSEDAGVDAWDYAPTRLPDLLDRMACNSKLEDELEGAAVGFKTGS